MDPVDQPLAGQVLDIPAQGDHRDAEPLDQVGQPHGSALAHLAQDELMALLDEQGGLLTLDVPILAL
ncbi:hypothetical protein GCM10020219_059570 [Nonomuraea dietziae]